MFSLPGGTIAAQALLYVNQATLTPLPSTGAVTGGTGSYLGASGQFRIRAEGSTRVITFRILP